jgi:hypothetical protein
MKCDPFPSPTTKKCSEPIFLLGVKWASVGRGAAPCHWNWHQGQATRDLAGWTAPQRASSSSEAKPQNPSDAIHSRGVKSCKRWQRVSVWLSGLSKQMLWTMSRDHSREVQGSNEHATMLASMQHIKLIFRDGQKSVYCACKGGILGAEARDPVSNGQVCILVRICKWCRVLFLGGLHHKTRLCHLNS